MKDTRFQCYHSKLHLLPKDRLHSTALKPLIKETNLFENVSSYELVDIIIESFIFCVAAIKKDTSLGARAITGTCPDMCPEKVKFLVIVFSLVFTSSIS